MKSHCKPNESFATILFTKVPKIDALGEARTHGLQIMRLTRCLLRYGGLGHSTLFTVVPELLSLH